MMSLESITADLRRTFFETNLEALSLRSATEDAVRKADPSGRVHVLPDRTPVMVVGDHVLGLPPDEAFLRRTVAETEKINGSLAVFGLGMGHTVRLLRALTEAPIVVYEPDPGLLRTALEFGPSDLGGVNIVCSPHELTQTWTEFSSRSPNATLVRTQGYKEAFADEHERFSEAVQHLIERVGVNARTYHERGRDWILDMFANVDLLEHHPPFMALSGRLAGVPAFIVGAGPSLGKNVHLLEEASRKGLVIAVNSAGKVLAKHSLEPQVLACIESIDLSHLLRDLPYLDHVVRAFSLSAHPATLATGTGPLLPIWEALPEISRPLQDLTGHPGLAVAGSVSTAAFSLAHRLGCNPIVMLGHDLAYTGGLPYAAGSPYEKSRARMSADGRTMELLWDDVLKETHARAGSEVKNREPLYVVEAWGGEGTVPSGTNFTAVRTWLGDAADVLREAAPELRLVNATEGGARIRGFAERTLASVLEELPERNITPHSLVTMAHEAAVPIDRSQMTGWVDSQTRLIETVRRAARRTRRIAECCVRLIRGDDHERSRDGLLRLESAERTLRAAVSVAPIVNAWAHAAIDNVMSTDCSQDDVRERAADGTQQEALLAATIETSVTELQEELGKLRARLLQASIR